MILLGIGGNLPSDYGSPLETCRAALSALPQRGVVIRGCSRWYRTAPVPVSDQPWFVNAVVEVASALPPHALLAALGEVEAALGRVRTRRNAARVVDIDILDYRGWQAHSDLLTLPHPRLGERAFVLRPMADLVPDWRHPRTRKPLAALIAALPPDQAIEVMEGV